MPFIEDENAYRNKLKAFIEKFPDATEDDLKALFPRMNSTTETWARFHASAKRNRDGKAPASAAD